MHIISLLFATFAIGPFDSQLDYAGSNQGEIEFAIVNVPEDQARGMEWLITHMPKEDLKVLTGEFLLTNCNLAYEAWQSAPWGDEISEEVFFDAILPYASVNERRENWRGDFRNRFAEIVKDANSPSEATVLLNKQIYGMVGVKYSTDRPKADQSPSESIDAGMASCTGLSILLIDACRSAGVPARFAGTPLWYNETGNHSWVEIWDNGWHFTGGAEPTGDELDKGWFAGSASKATKGDPKHAIFAVTWNDVDQHFPLVWLPDDKTYGAIDVTDRYAKKEATKLVQIRVRALDKSGKRENIKVVVSNEIGELFLEGNTKDETADANDHLTFMLPAGKSFTLNCENDSVDVKVEEEIIVELSSQQITEEDAKYFAQFAWAKHVHGVKTERKSSFESKVIKMDDKSMPFWYTRYGDKPFGERSLWISMHGGGGAPAKVNTSQWENQKRLYTLDEGVYVAPRAPTDTWNLWHQKHIDPMFLRLIENMVVFEGVDPNRVYIIGYSAGGDGVYQLAPRMADRLAAAGMMAGHPNETKPDGLRNIGFALHMGGNDAAYDRNKVAAEWGKQLDALQTDDVDGYLHQVVIHEGKGHWMDRQETMALPWMAGFNRNPFPKKIVWVQDDVTHKQFYWLAVEDPQPRTKTVASINEQSITIETDYVGSLTIYLNDELVDFTLPVSLTVNGKSHGSYDVTRSFRVIKQTLRDPKDFYTAQISILN